MKVVTPEISWHEREPIYSVDFQPGSWLIQRLASGGVDKIVRIWQLTLDTEGKGQVDFLSNLRRHTATVNVVRFSKNGELLATAGDDSTILLWKLNDIPTPANNIFSEEEVEEDKESWVCHKTLRGHLGDIVDLSWSKESTYMVSGSVDNCAVLWDVVKGVKIALFKEHKSYVQGVAFDPLGNYIATLSADRSLRLYNVNSKNCVHNVSKIMPPAVLASSETTTSTNGEGKPKAFRIFHDDGLRSFFRRLEFSPDGQLLIAPAGCMELVDNKLVNATFIFARGAFSKPAVYLPSSERPTTVVKVNPQLFELRPATEEDITDSETDNRKPWEKHKSLFCLPYRMVFAVATEDSVLLYDTQQSLPIGLLKNMHYHQISDMSWSRTGGVLVVSSTDGYCSIVTFEENELGVPYKEPFIDVSKPALIITPGSKSPSEVVSDKKSKEIVTDKKSTEILTDKKLTEIVTDKSTEVTPVRRTLSILQMFENKKADKVSDSSASVPTASDNLNQPKVAHSPEAHKELSVSPATSSQSDLSRQVSEITLKTVDAAVLGAEHIKVEEQKPVEENNTEEPKKKRIQITTLSLLNKK